MKLGVNTYGITQRLGQDFFGTLSALKKAGAAVIEPCIVFGDTAKLEASLPQMYKKYTGGIWPYEKASDRINQVRDFGFEINGCHIMLSGDFLSEEIEGIVAEIVSFGANNNLSYYALSLIKDTTGIMAYVPILNSMAKELAKKKISFLYHNHAIECVAVNGVTAMDCILEHCPDIGLQPDLGWLQIGGVSPSDFVMRHRGRIGAIHLKDMPKEYLEDRPDTKFVAIGEGQLPFEECMSAIKECNIKDGHMILDQDNSAGDILDDIRRGIHNIKALL